MKGLYRIQWYGIFLLVFCMAGCQVKRPSIVISDADMENILYDYHMAKAMGEEVPYNDGYKKVLYVESVFKKYGITQATFDSSLVWYARNPETFSKVYTKVNQRLKAERDVINHLVSIRDNKPKESLPGDSIDVWAWRRIYQLSGIPMDNRVTFTLPSDTNFKDRDTLRWNVRFRFYNGTPDSMYAPVMAMQIVYKNDSILDDLLKVYSSGVKSLSLSGDTLGEIKEIRGFIYYPVENASQTLLADHISLMRYHSTDTLSVAKSDSTQTVKEEEPAKEELGVKPVEELKENNADEKTPIRTISRPRPTVKESIIKNESTGTKKEPTGIKPAAVKEVKKEPIRKLDTTNSGNRQSRKKVPE
ncbi:DUF4296 domain-containing protein [Bacteroides sp. UBA939]|uniref:DUF4296 domain-containing protein n=1 Tax=Bacteroides sp. UBA939 TaxID=1946092 RepID=UPI0039C8B1DC